MNLRLFVLLFACWCVLYSCKKPALHDAKLAPEDELNLKFTDTLTLRAFTVREDRLSVGNATIKTLGAMDDPVFGKTLASFYLQFKLEETPLDLGDSPMLDSLVLTLRYSDSYGDVTVPQSIQVFEMLEPIDENAEYYSDTTFSIDPSWVGEIPDFIPNLEDTLDLPEGNIPPQLRIRLADELGERLISAASDLTSQDAFEAILKGLYVYADTSDPGKGLVHFNPFSTYSNLSLYYHNSSGDSLLQKDFPINIDLNSLGLTNINGTVSHFKHNYQGSEVEPYINNQNPLGDSLVFLQPLAGLNVKFIVPYLKNLGNIMINKAELVVTQVVDQDPVGTDTSYATPSVLSLRPSNDDGTLDASSLILSENKKTSVINNTGTMVDRYELTYSIYAQNALDESEDFAIFMLPFSRQNTSKRLILGGGNHSKYRMKLNLTYTVIN